MVEIQRCGFGWVLACMTAFFTLAAGGRGSAQASEKSAPPQLSTTAIHNLTVAERIPFSDPPPLMLLPETKCDLKGNIHIVQSWSSPSLLGFTGFLSRVPIVKLSMTSKSLVQYSVPNLDGYRGVSRSDFDVSPDGRVYSLLEAIDASAKDSEQPQPSYFIAKYKDDGTMDSYFKLEEATQKRLQPSRFVIFQNGNVLVTGTAVAEGGGLRGFIAIFDRGGRFVSDVKVSDKPKPASKRKSQTSTKPAESETLESESQIAVSPASSSFMASAPAGNVYLLRGVTRPRLYVISATGEVVRDFEVPAPGPDLTPSNIALAGDDKVFISFTRVIGGLSQPSADSDGPRSLISVLSPQTGDVKAVYRLPAEAETFDIPACAPSSDNFLFVGDTANHQHQEVIRYVPR